MLAVLLATVLLMAGAAAAWTAFAAPEPGAGHPARPAVHSTAPRAP